MKHSQNVIEEEDSFAELHESDLDLEAELKKLQMIEEDEIRKGVGNNRAEGKDGGTKKNKKGGEKSSRGK